MKYSAIIFILFFPFFLFAQQNSVLSDGDWYRIAVEQTGVYQITYDNLSVYGIDVDNIDPRHIALYGHAAGMLTESMEEFYYSDPLPLAIQVIGEDDGSFDPDDYILFFGQGPGVWKLDEPTDRFHYVPDLYTDKTFYFLTIGNEKGKRIESEQSTELDPTGYPEFYDYPVSHQEELVNPGKSGKRWLGEDFSKTDTLTFNLETEESTSLSDDVNFNIVIAVKSTEPSTLRININRELYKILQLPYVQSNDIYRNYRIKEFDSVCTAGNSQTRVTLEYNRPNDSAQVWLDYFEMGFKQQKQFGTVDQMPFRTTENVGPGEITDFSLDDENPGQIEIWNVTDPVNVKEIETQVSGSSVLFRLPTDSLLEFHAFNGQSFYSPEFSDMISNQNLHAFTPPDLLIISYPDFIDQAQQVASFHEEADGMSVGVFSTDEVYNEFSAGKQDITAIRNFVRYLWTQPGWENKPAYVLLFGDASYDYKDRITNNTNFVPTYESDASANVVNSIASDRYFGLQDMDDPSGDSLPVAVGRIPVKTPYEAEAAVNKLMTYYSLNSLGAWKNEFMFIGDKGDNNLHMHYTEILSDTLVSLAPVLNNTKCYLDFYEPVGNQNPESEKIINDKMDKGVFYVNYTGHGGPTQLAKEDIVNSETVSGWTNSDYLPFWVMASGGVAHYDDPEMVSLAEQMTLKEGGGAIACIGNSRPAFAHTNFVLNLELINRLLGTETQDDVRLGDLVTHPGDLANAERWALIGDPALKIPFPEFNVHTTTLNGVNIEEFTDTIAPGDLLTFKGLITDKSNGNIQLGFSGTVDLKIYAPPYIRPTLGSQGAPVMDVIVQDSVLVVGTTEVVNGAFNIEVSLPSAYYEDFGQLKLSWYADNGETDASGYYTGTVFGGEPNGVGEFNGLADQIRVYPSPFTDYVHIRLPDINAGSVSFTVFNLTGSKVYSGQIDARISNAQINLQHLTKGMYMLRIGSDKFVKSFKILKN